MVRWGYSPSVRLFEAAACGCTILSDCWPGLDTILKIGDEVLLIENAEQVEELLMGMDDGEARRIGSRARERVLSQHSSNRRSEQFENYVALAQGGGLLPGRLTAVTRSATRTQEERYSSTDLVA